MTALSITPLNRTTVVPIIDIIGQTFVWIACAIGIGYPHDGEFERFS